VVLIIVACSTTFTSATIAIPKIGTSFEVYVIGPHLVSYILFHIITHSLCAANFTYKMRVQTSPHMIRTSTCPAKLHTAINSSHNSFTINRLDHPSLPTFNSKRKALVIRKHAVSKARLPRMQIFLDPWN